MLADLLYKSVLWFFLSLSRLETLAEIKVSNYMRWVLCPAGWKKGVFIPIKASSAIGAEGEGWEGLPRWSKEEQEMAGWARTGGGGTGLPGDRRIGGGYLYLGQFQRSPLSPWDQASNSTEINYCHNTHPTSLVCEPFSVRNTSGYCTAEVLKRTWKSHQTGF